MKTAVVPVVLLCAFAAQAGPPESAEALYKTAVRHEKRGQLEEARLNLLWLTNLYAESPLATRAKDEMSAIHLFQDGQARVRDGRYGPATVTFRAVAQVYPESPLAKQAAAASRIAERKEEKNGPPLVRSISFEGMSPASAREIFARLSEREIALAVDQPYRPEELEQARVAIAGLLAEKGIHNAQVLAGVSPLSGNRVKIAFFASSF